jgi:hypothetical protein
VPQFLPRTAVRDPGKAARKAAFSRFGTGRGISLPLKGLGKTKRNLCEPPHNAFARPGLGMGSREKESQEAHMRRTLSLIMAAAVSGFVFGTIIDTDETTANTKILIRSDVLPTTVIHGLHIALPENMTNFPKELVPLP